MNAETGLKERLMQEMKSKDGFKWLNIWFIAMFFLFEFPAYAIWTSFQIIYAELSGTHVILNSYWGSFYLASWIATFIIFTIGYLAIIKDISRINPVEFQQNEQPPP